MTRAGRPARPFLGRYTDPKPIRARPAFRIISVRRVDGGEPAVIVVPGPSADVPAAARALAEAARAHRSVDHPNLAKVSFHGEAEGTPVLEFAGAAVTDGVELIRIIGASRERLPYPAGDAFITGVRIALQAAHAVKDPRTGGPLCLGRLSLANILVAPTGEWRLVGLGHNFPVENEAGIPDGTVASFQAAELAIGGAPSPSGDYLACIQLMRSLTTYGDMSALFPVLLGTALDGHGLELVRHIRWLDQHIIAPPPTERASVAEGVAVAAKIRELLGVKLDPEDLRVRTVRFLAQAGLSNPVDPVALRLHIGPAARWFLRPDGGRQSLGKAQRGIVLALVDQHRAAAGTPISVNAIIEAGWPGERTIGRSGANRAHVTLNRLRNAGLRDVIEHVEDGYRLAAGVVVSEES